MSRLLFLSHSGIDTEAAKALKQRILSTPTAREQGLRIWFDKDDLRAGEPWQRQIEEAIGHSHAFAVYVGSKGVLNWVEAEVRLALNRAVSDPDYRFVPILADTAAGLEALPGFAKQFQGVSAVESQPEQFHKLLQTVIGGAGSGCLELEAEPFFGLRAIDESRGHLFFGRERETEDLVERVHATSLVLVTGDSGSGKSSLVGAGLVPRFRGGVLALLDGTRPEEAIWHVVITRPGNQPLRQLGEAVDQAAKSLGLPLADRGALADWAASGESDKVHRGLRCDLPPDQVRVLLVVDQFEELLTVTPLELRAPFIDLLLDLSDPGDGRHRVVLTMRQDYVNLCSPFERLMGRLGADNRRSRLRLGRVTDEGLRRIVIEPLHLAGIDRADAQTLATEVLRDMGERPGDLSLVQMALTETWRAWRQQGGDLLRAYAEIGRVEGALAQAAERVRTQVLTPDERKLLDSLLLRLVRLGDTGGATRRVAGRGELDDARWSLVQKLAGKEGKRLVLIGGSTGHPKAEIAHEAMVAAWPYFQNILQETAEEKRLLDSLIPRVQGWATQTDPGEREKRLATGADLELFSALADRNREWLSQQEQAFIAASKVAEEKRRQRERLMIRSLSGIAVMLLVAVAVSGWMGWRAMQAERTALDAERIAKEERDRAASSAKMALANESRALAALFENAFNQHRYVDAAKLALAAWPRTPDDDRPRWRTTIQAIGRAQRSQRLVIPELRHESVRGALYNNDETRILTWSGDGAARMWDAATGEALLALRHEEGVGGALYNNDETRILTWSGDNTARVWDAATGEALLELRHEESVRGALYNNDETRILTWSGDNTARVWDAATGDTLLELRHEKWVSGALFNADETRILTWSGDGAARMWDAATGEALLELRHKGYVWGGMAGALFNADATRILTWSRDDGAARMWDAATGEALLELRHEGPVSGALFNADETRILTWSGDNTARVWDAATGDALLSVRHEEWVGGALYNNDETRILTWSGDGAARMWDAATGEALLALRHEEGVSGALFNADETRILTWSGDNTARVWDAATGDALLSVRHEKWVSGALFNADATRILTWSGDGAARMWDAATGEAPLALLQEVEGAFFNAAGTRILTWSRVDIARVWDAATGEALLALPHAAWGALFSAAGTRILTWSYDNTARVWDAATGEALLELRHEGPVSGALFNADETRILTSSEDNTARVWDAATGEALLTLRHEEWVGGALYNNDETRILTWSGDGAARMWDAATGEALLELRHEEGVIGALFNADATRILTWSVDGTALWDATTGEALLTLRHKGYVWGMAGALFNAAGTRILTWSGDNTARMWDAATGEALLELRHEERVIGALFNADATRILTWSGDGAARMWDAATGEALLELRHELSLSMSGALFNADETRIMTWTWSNAARVWDTATGEVLLELLHEWEEDAEVEVALFNAAGTRILTWSRDSTARLWDVSRLPSGHLIDVVCGLLPDHEVGELEDRYDIVIADPICGPETPAPVWEQLKD